MYGKKNKNHIFWLQKSRSFVVRVAICPRFEHDFIALLASSYTHRHTHIDIEDSFFSLRKRKLLLNARECISDMAYCLVCYNYKQKQFWIGILMTKQIVAYFKPIWIIFLGEMQLGKLWMPSLLLVSVRAHTITHIAPELMHNATFFSPHRQWNIAVPGST